MADNWYQDSPIVDAPSAPAAPRPVARGSSAAQALGGSTTAPPPVKQPGATAARGISQPPAAPASDAWWEGAPVVQEPPAAPVAPPPREVGMGEGIARIVGQAAIPVAKTLGLATASLANLVGGREAANAVFRKTDEVVGDMQREYEFRPNEEVGLPTQIAGGVLSTPIELVGGFGTQHGINRAAEVLQRGGTGSEAATAGGVSGAVHAGLNLLPVKAGGAVGRVAERVVEKGVGRALAPTVAGGITGGTIAGGGDVLGTAAENAALPEGEQFQDLRQEASPGISAGLGAAFGAGAGRGSRASRKARAEAAPAPAQRAPAGSEAPAGSAGAAGADVEMQRRQRAAALPVPIELSKGEAMGEAGKHTQMQFERETAKDNEIGEPLRQAAAEKNERLQRNLDVMIDETGAEVGSGSDSRRLVGEAVTGALMKRIEAAKKQIADAYAKAEAAGEMQEPVKTDKLVNYLNETGPESINAPVLRAIRDKLVQLGGAKRDGEGGLLAGEMPLNDLEEVRKMINRVSSSAPDFHFGGEAKNLIDSMTEGVGGDLYKEARRLRAELGRDVNSRAVVDDLVRNKRGRADRAVAVEDVFASSILNRSLADVQHLHKVLMSAGEKGAQAWKELQGQTLRHIQEQATKGVGRDIRGNAIVSASGLDKAIRALDDGRLEFIFGKKGAETIRDLNDVASNVLTSPPGTVNSSNTTSALRNMVINAIDTMITFGVSGVPVPAMMVLRKGVAELKSRGARKRVAEALKQPEGLTAEGQRFQAETTPAEAGAPTQGGDQPAAALAMSSDPRLAEIARLRAATTNSEVHDVLDRRQRKVEAEIEADRQQVERNQKADEIDALARSSSDPEIRKALAARAEKLRGGAIPVGEAREVTVQQAEPAAPVEPTQIPAGEAVELMPEQVEPAPRPAEAPRSAAGSDTEAELTMLQPGAPARGTRRQPAGDMKKGGEVPANPFKARAELENNLRAKFGHKLIDALQKRNVITMGEAPADVPRDAQGRFTGNTVELFHDRLDADTAPGVLMHEVGMHYGMEKMLGETRYAELLDDVAKMRQRPEVAKAWKQVLEAYDLKEGSPEFLSEVAAHLVESAPDQPIVRRIIDAPRAYLYRQFGVNVGKTDPGLLRALATGALRKSAGVEAVSPNVASLATAGEQREEETAAQ